MFFCNMAFFENTTEKLSHVSEKLKVFSSNGCSWNLQLWAPLNEISRTVFNVSKI